MLASAVTPGQVRGHRPSLINRLSSVVLSPSLIVILSPDAIGTKNLIPIRVDSRRQVPLLCAYCLLRFGENHRKTEKELDIVGRGVI